MAEQTPKVHKTGTWSDDMEHFKVRMYTNIPPKTVLVGHNIFTKKSKIYSKALFHMPWFQSRFISLQNQNIDLHKQNFELDGEGLEVVVDAAVSYKVREPRAAEKMTVGKRWKHFLSGFSSKPISSILKAVVVAGVMVGSSILLGPLAGVLGTLAVTGSYVSLFYQDSDWVERQGAYQATYNNQAAIAELEQTIFDELRSYYASHTYDQIRGRSVDFNEPEFLNLRNSLEQFSHTYGLEVTRVNIKSADLTPESNALLQRKKETIVNADRIRREAEARAAEITAKTQAEAASTTAFYNSLKEAGMSEEAATELMKTRLLAQSGANMVVTSGMGGVVPAVNVGRTSAPPSEDENTAGPRTR
jgi:Membrane protease subunits, stomatin/prohibitin homologs